MPFIILPLYGVVKWCPVSEAMGLFFIIVYRPTADMSHTTERFRKGRMSRFLEKLIVVTLPSGNL
jgi:hypothetical protein